MSNYHQCTPSACVCVGKSTPPAHKTTTKCTFPTCSPTCIYIGKSTPPACQTAKNAPFEHACVLENPHYQHVKPPPTHPYYKHVKPPLTHLSNMYLCWKIYTTSTSNDHQHISATCICVGKSTPPACQTTTNDSNLSNMRLCWKCTPPARETTTNKCLQHVFVLENPHH